MLQYQPPQSTKPVAASTVRTVAVKFCAKLWTINKVGFNYLWSFVVQFLICNYIKVLFLVSATGEDSIVLYYLVESSQQELFLDVPDQALIWSL